MESIPSVKQYEEAIKNRLSPRQIEILQTIYHRPNSAATAIELASDMGYKSYRGANRQIGAIGQSFYEYTRVKPPIYSDDDERLAYFYLVGDYNGPGWKLWDELKLALENLNLVHEQVTRADYTNRLPTEVLPFEEHKLFVEGKVTEIFVNRYERNQKARAECIKYYGVVCQGCGFDFGEFYGQITQGFIHIHHIVPLADISKSYSIDPIKDLVPLCANCHSVVHLSKPILTIAELKKLIKKAAAANSR
jgi:5-methylcytosine-specific restriction protein A